MGINEMEFQWRLNWWYRPTQLDGFESSVSDYYDCFCDWKTNMELNSCPAGEADYVAAFVQNLRCDIRSRLSKYNFSGGLIFVFLAAKFEESMMRIDEAFKKNGADKPIDEMLSPAPPCIQASPVSSQSLSIVVESSCSTGLENKSLEDVVIADEESSDLEDDDKSSLERGASFPENETPKVFDELPEQILAVSPSNYPVLGRNDFDVTGVVEIGNVDNDESLKSVAKGDQDKEIISINVGRKVFEEMSHQNSVKTTEEIDGDKCSIPLIDCVPRVFDPGTSTNLGIHNKLFQPSIIVTTGSKSFTGKYCSISIVLSSEWEVVEDAHYFYSFNEMSKTLSLRSDCVSTQFIIFDKLPTQLSLEQRKGKGKVIMTAFDPGGVLGSKLLLVQGIFCWILFFDMPTFDNVLLNFYPWIDVIGDISPDGLLYDGIKGLLVLFLRDDRQYYGSIHEFVVDFRSWHLKGRPCIYSGETPSNLVVIIWIGKVLMVVFDPGGCVSKSPIPLSLTPSMVSAMFKCVGLVDDAMAKQPVAQHGQASIGDVDQFVSLLAKSLFVINPGCNYHSELRKQVFIKWQIGGLLIFVNGNIKVEGVSKTMLVTPWKRGSGIFPFVQGIGCCILFLDMLRVTGHKADHFEAVSIPIARSCLLGNNTQAREPLQGQSVLLFTSFQALSPRAASPIVQSEMANCCYPFIIVLEHFVWDPGATFVIVPFTSLRTRILLRV